MAQFDIDRPSTLVVAPLSIRLTDLDPGSTVNVTAQFQDDVGQQWTSHAIFVADTLGTVDFATAQPLSGTYSKPDPMGLFWSMSPISHGPEDVIPYINTVTQSLNPLQISLLAKIGDEILAETAVTRHFMTNNVERIDVREDGLVATLFMPITDETRSTALVVGGSGGGFGWSHQMASLLATQGCATMAIAYFDWQGNFGLPTGLMGIPLENFEQAIHYLGKMPNLNLDNLAAVGYSKGGELALLLGAQFPQIKRVAAYMPSGIVWQGFIFPEPKEPRSSWAYDSKALPFAHSATRWEHVHNIAHRIENSGDNVRAISDNAEIPVEKIDGPVLLISAGEDQVWPSSEMAKLIMTRLAYYGHLHTSQHLVLDGAGHNIGVPYLPNQVTNVAGDLKAWNALLEFLNPNVDHS